MKLFGKYTLVKLSVAAALSGAIAAGLLVYARNAAESYPRSPEGYAVLAAPAAPVAASVPIEVASYFMYACRHCAEFTPALDAWLAKEGDRVRVRRVPVGAGETFKRHAALYYTLAKMGDADRLESTIFAALQADSHAFDTDERMFAWLAEHGVNRARFAAVYQSSEVSAAIEAGNEEMERERISSVPTEVIGGKYVVSPTTAGGIHEALDVMTGRVDVLAKSAVAASETTRATSPQ